MTTSLSSDKMVFNDDLVAFAVDTQVPPVSIGDVSLLSAERSLAIFLDPSRPLSSSFRSSVLSFYHDVVLFSPLSTPQERSLVLSLLSADFSVVAVSRDLLSPVYRTEFLSAAADHRLLLLDVCLLTGVSSPSPEAFSLLCHRFMAANAECALCNSPRDAFADVFPSLSYPVSFLS
ncbi:MAG: hypothetical protein II951_09805 [Bacteroidales bacterium]|nr:hypothetical protein [Bacteroidales bacterium]